MFSRRKKLTEQDCKEIYDEYQYQNEAAALDLFYRKGYHSLTTFYKCLANEGQINPLWKHPPHSSKWNEDLINQACNYISNHQTATLEEIIAYMEENYNAPHIEKTTLSQYLCFSLITLKKVQYQPIARNSPQTMRQRIDYGEFFIENENSHFIFIDEVGYTIAVQRNRGRSPKGEPVILKMPLHRTANTSVCMAIDNQNIIHYEKKDTSFDSESFKNFLKELIEIIERSNLKNVCLILDNSPVHRKEDVKEVCENKVKYRFLPVYSPNLNPIENIFGLIKNIMRKLLATTYRNELLDTFNLPWGQKTMARQEILDSCFVTAASQISQENLTNTYNHMKKYIALALEGKEI